MATRRAYVARSVFLGGMLIACMGAAVSAQVLVESVSNELSVTPPGLITLVFRITNTGSTTDTFILQASVPRGWSTISASGPLRLDAGASATALVLLRVPVGARPGDYEILAQITSQSNPSVKDETTQMITVQPTAAVEFLVLQERVGAIPGGTAEHSLWVVNRGNLPSEFEISARSSSPAKVNPEFVALKPGERAGAVVVHWVPNDAVPGKAIPITVTVTSIRQADVSDTISLSTVVSPPSPEAVGGTLMEELSARLRCAISQDVFEKELDSNLAFSLTGRVEDGYVSSYLRASPIFGPDPLAVSSFSILYWCTPGIYVIGDTSEQLTDLLTLSCRGGRVEIDAETYDLVFLGGGSGGETRAGGHFVLGPEEANVGIGYMERREEENQRAAWSLTASAKPFEDWTLRLEGALGKHNTLTSRAFFLASKIDIASYFLNAEAFSVGTHFPGQRSDAAGISLSQRLRHEDLSLSTSLSHVWDNVIGDPLVSTTITDRLGLNFYVIPLDNGPTLTSTAGFSWERNEDLSLENDIERLLLVAMSNSRGEFPYVFSSKLTDRVDHVAGTFYRDLSFSEGVGLSIEDFELFLKLTQEKTEDYLSGDLLTGGTSISLRFNSRSALHSVRMALANMEDDFDLSLQLDVRLLEDVHVLFDGTLGWDRADAAAITFQWGMTFDYRFDLPIPFLVTKGRIAGRVFVDTNGNGRYDGAELGLSDLVLVTDDSQVLTGENGHFRSSPQPPGRYSLRIVNLPWEYIPLKLEPIVVSLEAGEVTAIQVPIVEGASITGRVVAFPEVPPEGPYLEGTGEAEVMKALEQGIGLPNITVTLTSDEEAFIQATDQNGAFQFSRLRPGHWTLEVTSDPLPRFHYLDQNVFEFDLRPNEHVEQTVKVLVKRRPIQIIEEEELQVEGK